MELLQSLLPLTLLQASFPGSLSQTWSVWMPSSIQALKGSCVEIPCTFTHPQPYNASEGFHIVWYLKRLNSYPEVYNSRGSGRVERPFQGRTEMIGDIKKKTCSLKINNVTAEDKEVYYVRINPETNSYQSGNGSTQLKISDTPQNLSLSNPGIMSEGKPVNISCSAEYTCASKPPTLSWNQSGVKIILRPEELSGGRWRMVTLLTYSPSYKYHKKSLQCKATYPNKQISQKTITFNILYRPKETTASVIGNLTVRQGDSVTLKCSSLANPTVMSYSWYQCHRKEALEEKGQQITLRNITWNSGPYCCKAQNANGAGDSLPLTLNILYPPQDTLAFALENSVRQEGDSVTLTCSSRSNPAVTNYSWYQGIEEEALQHHGQQITLQNVSWDGGPYYCRVQNALGTGLSPPLNLNLLYAPKGTHLVAPEKDPIDEGGSLVLRCETSSSNPAVTHYTWHKAGNLIVNQSQETLRIESVTAQDAGTYHCTAHNDIGSLSSPPVTISVTGFRWALIIGGAVGAFLFLILLGLTIFFCTRKKKTQGKVIPDKVTFSTTLEACAAADVTSNDYTDATYTALDLRSISADYAELKVKHPSKESKEPVYENLKGLSAPPEDEERSRNSAPAHRKMSEQNRERSEDLV
ncbi:sialoadhesin-like [Rhinatrema bivittatum]|uniref:sialoadhesin-like n=1 Tax=Rhinatrema bivittatum TaxID=194408 RepID=UPI0011276D7E|nr:sialoadhesin-like [Rhinatrema bivittatum]